MNDSPASIGLAALSFTLAELTNAVFAIDPKDKRYQNTMTMISQIADQAASDLKNCLMILQTARGESRFPGAGSR